MKKPNSFDKLLDSAKAPYGLRKDGKPRRRPGADNISKYNKQRKAQKGKESPQLTETKPQQVDKDSKILQKDLFRLGKEAISTLRKALKDPDPKVRLQAATAATRTSILGLAKDALVGDGLSTINIYHSTPGGQEEAQTDDQAQEILDQADKDAKHPRTGKAVTIVR